MREGLVISRLGKSELEALFRNQDQTKITDCLVFFVLDYSAQQLLH